MFTEKYETDLDKQCGFNPILNTHSNLLAANRTFAISPVSDLYRHHRTELNSTLWVISEKVRQMAKMAAYCDLTPSLRNHFTMRLHASEITPRAHAMAHRDQRHCLGSGLARSYRPPRTVRVLTRFQLHCTSRSDVTSCAHSTR